MPLIELLKKSHCVFTCSPYLQKKKKIFNKNTYFIGNPADYSHFSKAQNEKIQIPQDLLSIPKPIIGFIGAIDKYKIDFKLIQNLAVTNPNWSIVLVGGIGEAEKKANIRIFKKRKNIYLLGKKDYDILPNYIKAFDIAIIPYIKNEYTRCCAPLKLFEFLSSGKPVVLSGVTITKELKNIVKCANTFEEFEEAINKYLINDNQENRNRRINIAKENTWEKKIERQKNIIRKFYPTFRRF